MIEVQRVLRAVAAVKRKKYYHRTHMHIHIHKHSVIITIAISPDVVIQDWLK